MQTLTLRAKTATITGYDYKAIDIEMDVNDSEFDTEQIAKCVPIDTFCNAHDVDEIMNYLKANYDWED